MQDTETQARTGRLTDETGQELDYATHTAAQAARQLREQTAALRAMQGPMNRACAYVRAHPAAAAAVAVGVGLIIAALTSRR